VKEVSAARTAKFSIIDYEATNWLKERNRQEEIRVLTFDEFVSKGDFTPVISKVMSVLKSNYKYPVDIEFTVNFKKNGKFTLNLVQCRPLQTRGLG
jgi:superfamily I DNA and RNA helicase